MSLEVSSGRKSQRSFVSNGLRNPFKANASNHMKTILLRNDDFSSGHTLCENVIKGLYKEALLKRALLKFGISTIVLIFFKEYKQMHYILTALRLIRGLISHISNTLYRQIINKVLLPSDAFPKCVNLKV